MADKNPRSPSFFTRFRKRTKTLPTMDESVTDFAAGREYQVDVIKKVGQAVPANDNGLSNLSTSVNVPDNLEDHTQQEYRRGPVRTRRRYPPPPISLSSPINCQGNMMSRGPRQGPGMASRPVKHAEAKQREIQEKAKLLNLPPPPYEFLELIGKGAYGLVFKGKHIRTNELVAVKIQDLDAPDYEMKDSKQRETALEEYLREIKVLKQLKEINAKNVNQIHEAFLFSEQMWIVTDYCTGGSLRTLSVAQIGRTFQEKYIIPIARELAEALKSVHAAGIIHRDVKCANVLITEDGQLQLCDFGVSAILGNNLDKRKTFIGTVHWMPPELHNPTAIITDGYNTEFDVWSYGCTMIELATGLPPHPKLTPDELAVASTPRLEADHYTNDLKDFVSYVLEEDRFRRPDMEAVSRHPYIVNTARRFPASGLKRLVEDFVSYMMRGGERKSLFLDRGDEVKFPDAQLGEEWNFSTTLDFQMQFEKSRQGSSNLGDSLSQIVPHTEPQSGPTNRANTRAYEENEQRVQRGGLAMGRIFDENAAPYEYIEGRNSDHEESDLAFRNEYMDSPTIRGSQYGLPEPTPMLDLDMALASTAKAKRWTLDSDDLAPEYSDAKESEESRRATRDWKFPTANDSMEEGLDRRATKEWKFPVSGPHQLQLMNEFESIQSAPTSGMFSSSASPATLTTTSAPDTPQVPSLNLNPIEITRPSTATGPTITSDSPFNFENLADVAGSRSSLHKVSKSAPNSNETGGHQSNIQERPEFAHPIGLRSRQTSVSSDGSDPDTQALRRRQGRHARAAARRMEQDQSHSGLRAPAADMHAMQSRKYHDSRSLASDPYYTGHSNTEGSSDSPSSGQDLPFRRRTDYLTSEDEDELQEPRIPPMPVFPAAGALQEDSDTPVMAEDLRIQIQQLADALSEATKGMSIL